MTSAPTTLDPSSSVLFLGSGFTREAMSIRKKHVPTGGEFKSEIATLVGAAAEDYDLKVLAEELASRSAETLYQLLYQSFTITDLSADQKTITDNRWQRIYTTNYDDAVELAHKRQFTKYASYNYDDPKPKRIEPNAIIHLHGSIRQLTRDNVLDQLILTERSYVRQLFEKSLWYDDFVRDIKFCSACFFVGYSLSDHHIASLLFDNETLRKKTFFIRGMGDNPIFDHRVSPYGSVLPIAVGGFADLVKTLPRPSVAIDVYSLKSFRFLDPLKDKKTLSAPTALEILNLLTFGTFNYARCLSTLPKSEHVAARSAAVAQSVGLVNASRCLLVHSRLGNGKTIFLYILCTQLSELGFKCLFYQGESPRFQQELTLLAALPKCIVVFDSYTESQIAIAHIAEACPNAKFLVAVRTGIHDVRLHEIDKELPKPLARQNLNPFGHESIDDFLNICRIAGLGSGEIELVRRARGELRDLLITLFKSEHIRKKIRETYGPIFSNERAKRVFVILFMLDWIGERVDASFLKAVSEADAYTEIAKVREAAGEILRMDDNELQVRPPIFAEYVIRNLSSSEDIVHSVFDITVAAAARKKERKYRVIMGNLMQSSNLHQLLRDDEHKFNHMGWLYEKLRYHSLVNEEPLFWLQYMIFMMDTENLQAAEEFMDTAYARAATTYGFKTFQIDTQALRLLMLIESREKGMPVKRFDDIINKLEIIAGMISDDSHRYHAIRVLAGVQPFIEERKSDLAIGEKNALVFWLSKCATALGGLSPDIRAQTASDRIRTSVLAAKEALLSP